MHRFQKSGACVLPCRGDSRHNDLDRVDTLFRSYQLPQGTQKVQKTASFYAREHKIISEELNCRPPSTHTRCFDFLCNLVNLFLLLHSSSTTKAHFSLCSPLSVSTESNNIMTATKLPVYFISHAGRIPCSCDVTCRHGAL